jgi:hypothetical protein
MTRSVKDARALLAVKVGDGTPLVPDDAQAHGPAAVIAAALKRLAAMKRPRSRVLHRRSTPPKACSGPYNMETDQ